MKDTGFMPIIGVFRNTQNPRLEVADVAKKQGHQVEIFPCNGRFDINAVFSIRRFLSEQEIEIIHCHGYKSNLYGLFAALGKKVHRISTCHNWLGDDAKMKFYAGLDKMLLRKFDRVIAVSEPVNTEILNHKINPKRVAIIQNGIDLNRFNKSSRVDSLRNEFCIDKSYKVIGTVGRLSKEKAQQNLLSAAEKILKTKHNIVFLFVGDGPLKDILKDESIEITKRTGWKNEAGLSNPFIFAGVREDMPDIYSLIDLFVLPSLTEGLPMVLLEAMASEKPVIATRVGEIPKVIEHDYSGLLVEPGDVQGLADSIMMLLENPDKASQLAKNGYRKVEQEFSSKRMANEYMKVYHELLSADYAD
ncbi:MAG: glycosyltransferase family 4 protein [Tissierellales bacterium]|nr:glycosyltransferase family 4 protein [Tissierellales bacterium]